jgi:putative flippase GtrA
MISAESAMQYAKFLVVGLANTLLSFVIYAVLVRLGLYYVAAWVIAFLVGALQGYLVNRYWTFSLPGFSLATLIRYLTVQLLVLGISTGFLIAAVEDVRANKLVAQAVLLPFVSLLNFVLIRTWALAPARQTPRAT